MRTCAAMTAPLPSSDGIGGKAIPASLSSAPSSSASCCSSFAIGEAAAAVLGGGVPAAGAGLAPSTLRLRRFLAIITTPPVGVPVTGRHSCSLFLSGHRAPIREQILPAGQQSGLWPGGENCRNTYHDTGSTNRQYFMLTFTIINHDS